MGMSPDVGLAFFSQRSSCLRTFSIPALALAAILLSASPYKPVSDQQKFKWMRIVTQHELGIHLSQRAFHVSDTHLVGAPHNENFLECVEGDVSVSLRYWVTHWNRSGCHSSLRGTSAESAEMSGEWCSAKTSTAKTTSNLKLQNWDVYRCIVRSDQSNIPDCISVQVWGAENRPNAPKTGRMWTLPLDFTCAQKLWWVKFQLFIPHSKSSY